MTALEILKQKKVLKQDFDPKKPFQLNLTRDGHKKSIEDILSAMEIFAEQEAKAYASRQIADFREKLSRIIKNVQLIDAEREEKAQVFSPSTNHRLEVIIRMAQGLRDRLASMEVEAGLNLNIAK